MGAVFYRPPGTFRKKGTVAAETVTAASNRK
jgi:hypothetical protein